MISPGIVKMTPAASLSPADAAVCTVPDPDGILEQALHAFVVPRNGVEVTEEELVAHCRRQLETYKVPARFHFRSSLPKSSIGKANRHLLVGESAAQPRS